VASTTVFDLDAGAVVCERCELAETPWRRARGLLGRSALHPGEGVLLRPTAAIHTWFMRFAIDAVFLDADLQVIDVREELRPWRATGKRGARAVLELPAGEGRRRGLAAGTRLALDLDEEQR
jgi:hypothetical protein